MKSYSCSCSYSYSKLSLLALAFAVVPARADDAPRPARHVIDSLRVAEDLADLGLEDEALEEYRDILGRASDRDELKRAWYGVARCELMRRRFDQALETYRDIAARYPEEQKRVAFLRLRYHRDRWQWKECRDLLLALGGRLDLLEGERAEVGALAAWVERQLELRPLVEERFDGRLGPEWLLSRPQGARVSVPRGDIEVRLGALALVTPVPWQGEPFAFQADFKVIEIEPGAVARIGLAGGAPGLPRTGDRIYVEIAAPEDMAGEPGAGRLAASLVAVAGDARVERPAVPAETGLALDAWYRVKVELAPALSRARIELTERGEGSGAAGRAFQAELALPRAFAPDTYLFGVLLPADEPEGAPATLFLDDARLRVAADAAARPLPPSGLAPAEEAYMRGNAALASGMPADALFHYRAATAADPYFDAAWFGAGLAARDAGDLPGAARSFATIVRADARAREAFRGVADELAASGKPIDLVEALERFLAVEPDDAARKAALEAARRRLADSLDLENETQGGFTPADRLRRGRLFLRAGAPDRALAEVARAGKIDEDARLLTLRARARLAKGEPSLAVIDLHRAARLDAPDPRNPPDPEPWIFLARLLLDETIDAIDVARPEEQAEGLLSKALKLAPERADILRLRARARLALRRFDDARADAERAIEIDPRAAEGHALAATIALASGRRPDAARHVRLARRLGPVDPALIGAAGEAAPPPR